MTITTNDTGDFVLESRLLNNRNIYKAAAGTLAAATLLARLLVSNTMTVDITRAGSSTSTATAAATAGKTAQVGAYVITAGTLSSGVGTWTLVAPDGTVEVFTSTASDDDLVFPTLTLTVTELETPAEWETGDIITVTTTAATGTPLVVYSPTGVNGAQVPIGVLRHALVYAAGGTKQGAVLEQGIVNSTRLVIDEDGDATNITLAILDQLRDAGIGSSAVTQNAVLDNYT
jgi:hypothetical protein